VENASLTGSLEVATVERARALATALEASPQRGRAAGSPGYRRWIESSIAPACSQLAARSPEEPHRQKAPSAGSWVLPFAAGLLLALGAGLILQSLSQSGLMSALTGSSREAPSSQILPGAAYAFLHPTGGMRGGVPEVELPNPESALLLIAVTRPEALSKTVQLSLEPLDEGRSTIWAGTSSLGPDGEIRVVVPASLLPVGSYRLRTIDEGDDSGEIFHFQVVP